MSRWGFDINEAKNSWKMVLLVAQSVLDENEDCRIEDLVQRKKKRGGVFVRQETLWP